MHGSRQRLKCSFMPAYLRCRALVNTNVLLLLYVLCCSVQGRLQAVLLCLRYVSTSVVIGDWYVVSWCGQKQVQNQNQKKEKKNKKRGKKTVQGSIRIFFFDRRQLQADKGCGVGENNDVLRSRRGLQWVRLNLTRVRSELQILVKSQKQISFVQIERGLLCGECAPRLICLLSCDSAVRFSESDNSRQRRILPCLAPRRVHFAPPWIQASEPALTDSSLAPKRRAEALHVVFFPTKHPSPCCCA